VIWFHNGRGDAENYINLLRGEFGMDYAPCRSLAADAVYFEIGVLAYNLTIAVMRLLQGGDWVQRTIASLRWRARWCGQGGAPWTQARPPGAGEPLRAPRGCPSAADAVIGTGLGPVR
jgi:hypothetical protein